MTPKEFKKTYWPDIAASCEETGLNPLFVAAQAALEPVGESPQSETTSSA